jgi:purine-binding chemotaxis protein CheW
MIKRRKLNPNYRSEHVLEPLEPEPDQWLEEDEASEDSGGSGTLEAFPTLTLDEHSLADEPMEALFAELLAEEEMAAAPAPAALDMEEFPEAPAMVTAFAQDQPILVEEPLTEPVEAPAPAAAFEAPLFAAGLAKVAPLHAETPAPLEPEPATPLLPDPPATLLADDLNAAAFEDATFEDAAFEDAAFEEEAFAAEEPQFALAEPAEPEELDLGSWETADLAFELEAPAAPEKPAAPLVAADASSPDAVYEALEEIELPDDMDFLGSAREAAPVAAAPEQPLAAAPQVQPQTQPRPAAAAPPPAPADPFSLEPIEADPAADFESPVEAVLSEVAQIIAARGQSLLTRISKPAEPEPLPPQPALEELVSSIDEALEKVPVAVAPAGPAPVTPHRQFSQLDDYVVFSLSGGDYAIPVRDVAEIGRIPAITRIPNVPDFIRGITNLRGEVVPVLNLPTLLGLQDTLPSVRGRVLFLHGGTRGSATGLVVDEVKGIQRIQSTQLEQVSGLVDDKVTSVLRGVHGRGDRLLNVLDLEQLFAMPEFRQLEM